MKQGFDNEQYLRQQSAAILGPGVPFGGKIICDYHASRVLPGFHPNVKTRLQRWRKIRADFGITAAWRAD